MSPIARIVVRREGGSLRLLLAAADWLRQGFKSLNGGLEPGEVERATHQQNLAALQSLTRNAGLTAVDIRVLAGAAEEALPNFAAGRGYDAFVMGALTHRKGLSALVGTLTTKLVETLNCDFVLVKPMSYQSQIELGVPMLPEEPELEAAPQPQRSDTLGFVSPWQLRVR